MRFRNKINGQTIGAPWPVGCVAATEGPFLSCTADATAGVDKMLVGGKVVVVEEGALVTLEANTKMVSGLFKNGLRFSYNLVWGALHVSSWRHLLLTL